MSATGFSVCVLLYGDHVRLAHRCLSSIWSSLRDAKGLVRDLRIGMNETGERTRGVVDWFTEHAHRVYRLPVITYSCPVNALKYPLMRRMLLDDPDQPAEWVMWFDDDSYLDGRPDWWRSVWRRITAERADMLGKIYWQDLQGKQGEWIQAQPWYSPQVGLPPVSGRRGRPRFRFATGGWWTIRHELLRRWDWPTPELRHCGGDSMLGELLRQQRCRLVEFEDGVRINADERGRHSKAAPRGASLRRRQLGTDGVGPVDLSHQRFVCTRTRHE